MTWRDQIRPLVAEIIAQVGINDEKKLRRALLDERPVWVRTTSHMSKIWRDEVRRQVGKARDER